MTPTKLHLAALAAAITIAFSFSPPAPAQEIGKTVPGYAATKKKVVIKRDAILKQSKLPALFELPAPKNVIALPDDWAKSAANAPLSIRLSQSSPGKLLVRRVANNDGKLYLEVYCSPGKLAGNATVEMAGKTLANGKVDGSLWFSLKPQIGQITIHVAAAGENTQLTAPSTLVEIRGRQIFLNGEVFLMKGVTGSPENAGIADYIHTLGINTLRGNTAAASGAEHGFMALASLNSINAPKDIFGKPDDEFWRTAQPFIDKIPETGAATIDNPWTLIVQLGNERTGGGRPPGTAPLSAQHRQISQMLVHARNAIKPLCPMLPLGYASQDFGHIIPDCLDVYMHNSFLDKDRYEFPWDLFMKWQGCLPPDGLRGEGRPFVNSEFGANRYLPQSYHQGPNNPVLEKLHAWNFPNRWAEFMQHGTVGGAIYNLSDNKDFRDQGCSRFGILTDDNKTKLICWEVAKLWRDFAVDLHGENLRITYKRDYHARDCRLVITPVTGEPLHFKLSDFSPRTSTFVALELWGKANPLTNGFRWRIDYNTHSGLVNVAAGAWPAKLEAEDFLERIAKRDTASFLTELFDAEVLTIDGKPAPLTLAEMTDSNGIIPVILRKPNGVVYLVPISRELITEKNGPIKEGVNLEIAFKGRIEQVDDITGQPLLGAGAIDAKPQKTGLRLKNIKASRIPGAIGQRSEKPFMMPVYRITPQ